MTDVRTPGTDGTAAVPTTSAIGSVVIAFTGDFDPVAASAAAALLDDVDVRFLDDPATLRAGDVLITLPNGVRMERAWLRELVATCVERGGAVGVGLIDSTDTVAHVGGARSDDGHVRPFGAGCTRGSSVLFTTTRRGVPLFAPHAVRISSPGHGAAALAADPVIGDVLGHLVAAGGNVVAAGGSVVAAEGSVIASASASAARPIRIADAVPGAVLALGSTGAEDRDRELMSALAARSHVVWHRPGNAPGGLEASIGRDGVFVFDTDHPDALTVDALASAFAVDVVIHLDDSVLADGPSLQHLMRARPGSSSVVLRDRCSEELAARCEVVLDDADVVAWLDARSVEPASAGEVAEIPEVDVAAGVTSIVIPVHGQWSMTRRCLESIQTNTDGDVRIVVVDDASPDDTAARLAERPDVVVVTNEENLGFPGSVNRGLRAADGEFVCILNNDTEVTPGWLAEMKSALSQPGTVMVGPRSNEISGLQRVGDAPPLSDRDAAHSWAADWADTRASTSWPTTRLVGFCLLARRETFVQHGGLDEVFGRGNFEDDELCDRLRAAGGILRVADGSVVLHHGSATFASLDIDYVATLASASRNHRHRDVPDCGDVTTVVLADGSHDLTRATVHSVLGLGGRVRVVERNDPDVAALHLAHTERLGVEIVAVDWQTGAGASDVIDGLGTDFVFVVAAGEVVAANEWGATRVELDRLVGERHGVLVDGHGEIRVHRPSSALFDEIGRQSDAVLEHLLVHSQPRATTEPQTEPEEAQAAASETVAADSDTPEAQAHPVPGLRPVHAGMPTLVAAVLCDNDAGTADDDIELTIGSAAVIADAVLVLERGDTDTTEMFGAPVVAVDWADETQLAVVLDELGADWLLVLGAGEQLVVEPTAWAGELCLLGAAPVAVLLGDEAEIRLAPCAKASIDSIGSAPNGSLRTSGALRIVPADLEHRDVIAARYPELAAASALRSAHAGRPEWAERLAETLVLDEEARTLEQIRAERPIVWPADVSDVQVGVVLAWLGDSSEVRSAEPPEAVRSAARLVDTCNTLHWQDHRPVEIVIVTPPGVSLPEGVGTVRHVEHFGLVADEPDQATMARLMNLGTALVVGDWVALVDVGDVLRPDHLSHLLAVAVGDESEVVHGHVVHFHGNGSPRVDLAQTRHDVHGSFGPLLLAGELRALPLRPSAHRLPAFPSANRAERWRLLGVLESAAEQVTATRPIDPLAVSLQAAVSHRPLPRRSVSDSPAATGVRLHLGCGPNLLDDWTNIDLEADYHPDLVHDLSLGLPFDDNSVDLVYSEHFFEHLSLKQGLRLMTESRRVLRDGGRLRIAMPDLATTVMAYLGDWRDQAWVKNFPQLDTAAHMLNMGLRDWGHQYLYDIEDLTLRLHGVGFGEVHPQAWGETGLTEFVGLETRPDSLLIVEAW